MGRWTGLALAGFIVGGQAVVVVEKGIDGWTVFSAFVVGVLIVQSLHGWLIDGCREIIDRYRAMIEEITEGEDALPVDRPQGHGGGSGD